MVIEESLFTRTRSMRLAACIVVSLMVAGLVGCGSKSFKVEGAHQPIPKGGVDFGMFNSTVRPRMGGLPIDQGLTLYETADPDSLGPHSYTGSRVGGVAERHRGFVYCCRAGFVDISHMRKSADLARYAAARMEFALANDWSAIQISSIEPTRYIVRFEYPAFWKTLSAEQKKKYARELGIRIGQNLANVMITWHEVVTYYGYRSTVVIPESQSSFTYDDTGSHALGIELAGRAMRDDSRKWNAAMTYALDEAMKELGGCQPADTHRAIDACEGKWWSGSRTKRRQIEFGMEGHVLEPWIVPGFDRCPGARPIRLVMPSLQNVFGRDFSGIYSMEILPNVWQAGAIRNSIPGKPEKLFAHEHMPQIVDAIRQDFIKKNGANSVKPK